MYHSITFGDKNTWDDWYLIPSSRPLFKPPSVKTNYIDIPGADWHLDMSTSLTGEVAYEGRTGSIEFIVDNSRSKQYEWHELYSEIMNYLHGQYMKAVLEDDPAFYYIGRFSVNEWKSEPHNSKIVIDYNVAPYKYELTSSTEDWLWDPFNFETGIIREYGNMVVENELVLEIKGLRKSVTPTIDAILTDGNSLSVEFNGITYPLTNGSNKILDIVIKEGVNMLTFTGNGTVSVDYRGGSL